MAPEDLPRSKRRDLLELSIGYALILIVIWTPRPWQRLVYIAAAIFLAAVLCLSFDGWKSWGLRTANLGCSIWVVGVALLMAGIAVAIGHHMGTLRHNDGLLPFIKRYWGYSIWAFAQQVLLQDFFLLRLLRLIRKPHSAAFVAAAIFSLAHLPSPILTVVTLVWGYGACLLFLHHRNLYPLALAHAIFGVTIAVTIPGPVTHNMRVGLGYLTYHAHRGYHLNR
jgi:hypothetical protein